MNKLQIIILALLIAAIICIYVLVRKFPKKEYKGEELYVDPMPGSCAECKQYRRWFRRGCRHFFTLLGSGAPSQTSRRKDCPLRPMNKGDNHETAVFKEALFLIIEQATRSRRSNSQNSAFQGMLQELLEQAASNIEGQVGR